MAQSKGKVGADLGRATGSPLVFVCEHASNHIPASLNGLGLSQADRVSHAAWDPGALAVTQGLARHMGGVVVAADVSRLVYDCNRPPEAPDAMPARSELIEVPGNRDLSAAERAGRVAEFYLPFRDRLRRAIADAGRPIIVTVHSFTPVYFGKVRAVEIGILHDADTRLADALLDAARTHTAAQVERNQPYGPQDGVTHTLKEHAVGAGLLNVMLEIRNDLIATPEQQAAMAAMLSGWLADALAQVAGSVACRA